MLGWHAAWKALVAVVGLVASVIAIVEFLLSGEDVQPVAQSQIPTATPEGRPDEFRGGIGDLTRGQEFVDFIIRRDGEVVRIDATVDTQEVYADRTESDVPPHFTVWNECNGPLPREFPERACTGWSFNLVPDETTDSSLYVGSGTHLEGWFVIQVRGDMHMGRNFVTLKPLTAERAIALTRD